MKAICALVFVCLSIPAFAAPTDTLESPAAVEYPSYLDDFDFDFGEGMGPTRVPGIVVVPAEPETLVVEQDGVADDNKTNPVPGITAIQPDYEDDVTGITGETRMFVDPWDGY